jgi:hypothetical protein
MLQQDFRDDDADVAGATCCGDTRGVAPGLAPLRMGTTNVRSLRPCERRNARHARGDVLTDGRPHSQQRLGS